MSKSGIKNIYPACTSCGCRDPMDETNTGYLLNTGLFDVLKLTINDKTNQLNNPDINGEWKVYNTYPQTGNPLDSTERYYLHPDYVHEYDDNEDNDEVKLN